MAVGEKIVGTQVAIIDAGLGERMDAEGQIHSGTGIAYGGEHLFFVDIEQHANSRFMRAARR